MSKESKKCWDTSLPSSQDSSGLRGDSSPGLSSSKRLSKSNIDISAPNEGHGQSRPPLSRKQSDSYDGDSSSAGQRCFFSRWGEMRGTRSHLIASHARNILLTRSKAADSLKTRQEQHGEKGRKPSILPRPVEWNLSWQTFKKQQHKSRQAEVLSHNCSQISAHFKKRPWKGFVARLQCLALPLPDYK